MSEDADLVERSMKEFQDRFKGRLGQRALGFEIMLAYYLNHCDERPFIIETGTARQRGNWAGDGQSTLLWDWAVNQHEHGQAVSIDIDQAACRNAEIQVSERTKILCADSVYALANTDPDALKLTGLLYLDSFDLDVQNTWPSSMHHLKELTAVYAALPDNCLIAVDDCHSDKVGKHLLVMEFLKHTDAKRIYSGYQQVWKKF